MDTCEQGRSGALCEEASPQRGHAHVSWGWGWAGQVATPLRLAGEGSPGWGSLLGWEDNQLITYGGCNLSSETTAYERLLVLVLISSSRENKRRPP